MRYVITRIWWLTTICANPVEKFIKNPEGLNKSPGQNVYHESSSNSVQEVPHLQDMRNSNENEKGKELFEGNDNEPHTEDSEHESVGNESTLPLLESSMVISQGHEDTQNVSDSLSDNSSCNISHQVIREEHLQCNPESTISHPGILEGHIERDPESTISHSVIFERHVQCVSESINQVDDSIENPKLINNIEFVPSKDNEENINSTVDDLDETPQEIIESHQPDDICMSRIDTSKEPCDPIGEVMNPCDSSATSFNMSCSDNRFNHCGNIDVECQMGHNSAEPQQAGSVHNDDIAPSESVISMSENVESINLTSSEKQLESNGSKVNTAFDQSNIENIPPEELSNNNAGRKEMLTDLVNVVQIRKTGDTESGLGHNVLQELNIENNDDSMNSSHILKMDLIDKVSDDGTNVASESSEETTFVSLNSEEDNCISSSNSHYSSVNENQPEPQVKNKENEEPSSVQGNQDCVKSKIPISNHIKSTCIKPARLHHTPGTINEKWLNDLKRKKIPKPKKPDYMVSPAKLESIMKSRNQPMSPDKPDMKRSAQPKTASSAQHKVASSAPKPVPGNSRTLLTPRKKQFEYVKSPISAYIRTGTAIPTAKSLPALQSPNKIPVPITVKQTPVQKLPPKFYSSAEKLVIKSGPSASVPKPAENRLFLTPKIFKHQGRVADSKKPGDINVVTPRAVRKTNLTETSFACLPQSSKELEVSVLEEM